MNIGLLCTFNELLNTEVFLHALGGEMEYKLFTTKLRITSGETRLLTGI